MKNKEKEARVSQEYLKECVGYNPKTGFFTWRNRPAEHFKTERAWKTWNTRYSGKVTGRKKISGYIVISINYREFKAHRLAWLYVHGELPAHEIDHISGVKDDNRIVNLRPVTRSENLRNQKKYKNNTSGICGVYWHKGANKWVTSINTDGQRIHLGLFDNILDAACSRKSAENKYDYHANHGR